MMKQTRWRVVAGGPAGRTQGFGGITMGVVMVSLLLPVALPGAAALGADWPTWRYDANRSAASPQELPAELHLQWVRRSPPLKPAWHDPRVQFDGAYEPVVMGKTMFVGSSRTDSVTAIDTDTGKEKWRYYTEGPVRFAPVAWTGVVYVASDDGHLYCLDAAKGTLVWKFRGGPSDRRLLGNGRLVSMWAIRGGPALVDGTIYFAAGVWPFMGVFVYALDAATGKVQWKTDSGDPKWDIWGDDAGKTWERNNAFRGMVPDGYIVAVGDKLLVPSGRAGPACFDRTTGRFLYQKSGSRMRKGGGWHVSGIGEYFINDNTVYNVNTGQPAVARLRTTQGPILMPQRLISAMGNYDLSKVLTEEYERKGEKRTKVSFEKVSLALTGPRAKHYWAKAGSHLLGNDEGAVMALAMPAPDGQPGKPWTTEVEGTPSGMLAADGKVFVVTREGSIYCFGPGKVDAKTYPLERAQLPHAADGWAGAAGRILKQTGVSEGYCLLLGVGTGRLAEQLAAQSKLQIIVADPDARKLDALRRRLDAAGLYGERVSMLAGDPMKMSFPPYLASLIVSEDLDAAGLGAGKDFAAKIFHSLRPYGGVACFRVWADRAGALEQWAADAKLAGAVVKQADGLVMLIRSGALPGAGQWTHRNADAAHTLMSPDKRVKGPLGVLWYGGPAGGLTGEVRQGTDSYKPLTPRVVGGRLFIIGPGQLNAVDVYTGRPLWSAPLDNKVEVMRRALGKSIQIRSSSRPFVALEDAVYVASGTSLRKLSARTGKVDVQFTFEQDGPWEEVLVLKDTLIASAGARLYALNRHSGKVLWQGKAAEKLQFNALAAGGDKVFCLESVPPATEGAEKRRGQAPAAKSAICARDLRNGEPLWRQPTPTTRSALAYSEARDIVLLGSAAYRGKDGTVLRKGRGMEEPYILHGDTLYTQHKKGYNDGRNAGAVDLLTGDVKKSPHPITGTDVIWYFARSHGCSRILGSQHLLTFRSSTTAYCDLSSGGVTQLVGFRPFCATGSLVPADGLLNAPNLSACSCNYPIYTPMALIHDPQADAWSHYKMSNTPEVNQAYREAPGYVKRVGLNFGAPADRRADNGTLWLDYPSVGGWSPDVPVKTVPAKPQWFRHHASRVTEGDGLKWVQASGATDLKSVTIALKTDRPRSCTVRVYYAEPVGDDGSLRGSVEETKGVKAGPELKVTFRDGKLVCGIEVVVEAAAE